MDENGRTRKLRVVTYNIHRCRGLDGRTKPQRIAAVLASIGRKELKQIKGMPQTGETLSEIPPTLKPGEVNR